MSRILFQLWFAAWPLFLGVFEQTVDIAGHHYQNLLWGTIDGLGLWVMDESVGLSLTPSFGKVFGFVIWPILVSVILFWLGGRLWRKSSVRQSWLCAFLLLLTSLCSVDLNWRNPAVFDWLPLYYGYLFDFT